MTLKAKIILGIIVVLIAAVIYLQFNLQNTKKKLAKAQIDAQISLQNYNAYKDSVMMMARTLQEYYVAVKDLTEENKKLKDQNIYFKTQFRILLDSIEVLNKPAHVDTTNSDSNKIVITFEGKEGRIHYKGQVIYFKLTKEATHSIKITQDAIKIESIILLDTKTNLIKNKIYADGVLIDDAYTEVDSTLYAKLNTPSEVVNMALNFWDTIGFVIEANQEIMYNKDKSRWEQNRTGINVGLQYNLSRNLSFEVKKDLLNDIWQGSVMYNITPYRLWKMIF